jgi:hypothetical protein
VGRAPALLGLGLFGLLVAYYETAERFPEIGVWWDVAWIALVLLPAVFALVLLALPLRTSRWISGDADARPPDEWSSRHLLGILPGLAFGVLAAILTVVGVDVFANFSRLAAATLIGWWFLTFFEELSWVALVALIIPWIDAYSVWRGPTKQIVTNHEEVFTWLSFAFPVWGEPAAANLGVPDLLFFALFLGAAARWGLRVVPTYVCLVAALGATIAITVWLDLSGLPALPAISLGFLLPNADLIWRQRGPARTTTGDQAP